ncbi:unnamed protein product [Rhizophagus irregularis]|nr:unnamed protein product [Rhizophagus irregularis]
MENLEINSRSWTSGNEIIDDFIREIQLKRFKRNNPNVFKWVPYNQFSNIKKIDNGDFAVATWKRNQCDVTVNLKYFYNSQNITTNKLRDEISIFVIYGISKNPDTKDYIFVFQDGYCEGCGEKYTEISYKWCKPCQIKNLKENFRNWTSGNEKIDNFIQEMQLEINHSYDIIFEWISYDQFSDIKEISNTLYSALWNDGQLKYEQNKKEWTRIQVEINLKLFNSQNTIDEFLNKVVEYKNDNEFKIYAYGVSQNPDTSDYILVLQDIYCKGCGEKYTNIFYKWCKPCQIKNLRENFKNWTSGNEKIDEFIQEMQLKVKHPFALWNDGQLEYDLNKKEWTRVQVEINLNPFNSQNTIDEFLNKVVKYKNDDNVKIYGISQNSDTNDYILVLRTGCNCEMCGEKYTEILYKWCNPCQIKNLKENFRNWISGNEKIDNFIQEMQLKVNHSYDIIFEWISYDQFSNIKKIGNAIYSALWNNFNKKEWTRVQVEINLNQFNSQNTIDDFLNKVIEYKNDNNVEIYGISQNPDTNDYILVLQTGCNCEVCEIGLVEMKKIDNFIQEIQLEVNHLYDIIFEWISYDQFSDIKKIGNIIYSALWKDGPLRYNPNKKEWTRVQAKIYLKPCNSQNTIDEFLNKVVEYKNDNFKIYGISQNPDTKDYILVLQNIYCKGCGEKYTEIWDKWCNPCQVKNLKENFKNWTSGNEKIDEFIQEMQLKVNSSHNIIFEWISYDQFSDIKKIGNTIYSALWNDGKLKYNRYKKEWTRVQVEINLKLFNSQNTIDEFLNKVVEYINDDNVIIYGISQNPDAKDYILVLQTGCNCEECGEKYTEIWDKWCNLCQMKNLKENFRNWTSGNEKIDNFIQKIQLKVHHSYDIIFEWISYNQFSDIKKIGNTIYSALWNDGQLKYDQNKKDWTRVQAEINLKLFNSQNTIDEFLNKVVKYKNDDYVKIYGISQNFDTRDYILVLQAGCNCEECGEKYTEILDKWCNPCQVKNLKENFKNWTSGNEKIDNFIQEIQLKVNYSYDIIFEWISYDQFSDIKKISNTIYSALWNDGQLKYDQNKKECTRVQVEINLKLFNSQNTIDEFLNKVVEYKNDDFKIYGISQNPDTKGYILVLQTGYYCEECDEKYTIASYKWCEPCQIKNLRKNFKNWTSENEKIDNFIQEMQLEKNSPYNTIIFEWISYDQFSDIKKIGNTTYSALWNDGPLKYNQNKEEWARIQFEEVILKLCNSQYMIDEFLNKIKVYENDKIFEIYGISQDSDTKDYIMVLQKKYDERYCEKCIEEYTEVEYKMV